MVGGVTRKKAGASSFVAASAGGLLTMIAAMVIKMANDAGVVGLTRYQPAGKRAVSSSQASLDVKGR
jgi:2-keto-3-deoxy-L-rhamnonate aldolase RhmA